MANSQKTYLLVPNFDMHPTTGPLQLGTLLADPARPTRPLNSAADRVPPPPHAVTAHTKTDWRHTATRARAGRLGVWASFLQVVVGVGAGAGASWDRAREEECAFDELETLAFEPGAVEGYVAEALARAPRAVRFLEKRRWRKAVYMVVGVKVVRGGKIRTLRRKADGVDLGAGVDGTMVGAPASVGPQVEIERAKEEVVAWAGSDDFVFAYRVRRIKVSSWTGGIGEGEDYVKGALFEIGDDDAERESRFVVEEVGKVDAGAGGPGFEVAHAHDDDDGDDDNVCGILVTCKGK